MVYAGQITLGNTCDVTDPCYNEYVWCRHTVNVKPGVYNCYLEIADEGCWGMRVARSWIIHEDYSGLKELKKSRDTYECGVDAGLLGYFDNKPDFTDAEWEAVCDEIDNKKFVVGKYRGRDGFFTHSGYGDGCYDVTLYESDGENVAIETVFITKRRKG